MCIYVYIYIHIYNTYTYNTYIYKYIIHIYIYKYIYLTSYFPYSNMHIFASFRINGRNFDIAREICL